MTDDAWGFAALQTADEIRAHFRRLAKVHHPDKGGDAQQFQALQERFRAAIGAADAPPLLGACPACNGTGRTTTLAGFYSIKLACGECGGAGEVG